MKRERTLNLEKKSLQNLIYFYKPELLRIINNGELVNEVFSTFTRRRLTRLGLLCLTYRPGGGRHLQVSEKVLEVLEEVQP